MKKLLFIPILLLFSCVGNNDRYQEEYSDYVEYYELYTTYFSHVAVVQIKNIEAIKNGCKIEIDLYETSERFREKMDEKYTADEFVPYNGFNSKYDDFELPLDEMKHMRSIYYSDRIRPIRCISESPREELTEYIFINWIEGMEPVLGHSGHDINRSDTALVVNISHEIHYYYLW